MTRYQLSQISTMKQVRLTLERFGAIWAGFAGFAGQVKVLGSKIELILVLAQEQERDKRGLRADKERLTDLLSDAVMAVAGPLGAWAMVTQKEALRLQVDFYPSGLKKMAAERLLLVAKEVLALGQTHAADTAEYALTNGELEVLGSRIATFEQLVTSPREGVARTAALTKLIESEVDGAMELLKLFFDRVMFRFKESDPEFFTNYQTARKVIQPAYRSEEAAEAARLKREAAKKTAEADASTDSGAGAGVGAEEASAAEVQAVIGSHGGSGSAGEGETVAIEARVVERGGAELAG